MVTASVILAICCAFVGGVGVNQALEDTCHTLSRDRMTGAIVFLVFSLVFGAFGVML